MDLGGEARTTWAELLADFIRRPDAAVLFVDLAQRAYPEAPCFREVLRRFKARAMAVLRDYVRPDQVQHLTAAVATGRLNCVGVCSPMTSMCASPVWSDQRWQATTLRLLGLRSDF